MITISMPPSKIFDMDDEAGFDLVHKQKVQKLPHALMDAIGKLYPGCGVKHKILG